VLVHEVIDPRDNELRVLDLHAQDVVVVGHVALAFEVLKTHRFGLDQGEDG
jgi:hypothetical protein